MVRVEARTSPVPERVATAAASAAIALTNRPGLKASRLPPQRRAHGRGSQSSTTKLAPWTQTSSWAQLRARSALAEVVEAKTNGKPLPPRKVAAQPDNVVDLMAALKAAVEQTSSVRHKCGRAPARKATAARSASRTRRAS